VIAYTDATIVTGVVIAFFAFLALLVFLRLTLRKGDPPNRRTRIGVFIERDNERTPSVSARWPSEQVTQEMPALRPEEP